jgi:hypothetical protein
MDISEATPPPDRARSKTSALASSLVRYVRCVVRSVRDEVLYCGPCPNRHLINTWGRRW